ncbi:hypothetical protein [Rossellomorea vietnamensis]|uniref:hypothetical protein n=1 Tax=Rossellomorea vietnamensis TaxID=218284 RepID=UPI003D26BE51
MVRPDKHNWEIPKGAFCLMGFFSCDLEGLAAGAGHRRKAEGARPEATSISGKFLKALFAFGDFPEMTSSLKPLELDISKSGGGLVRPDKHKANQPEWRSLPFWLI